MQYIVYDQGKIVMPKAETSFHGFKGRKTDQKRELVRDDVESDLGSGYILASLDLPDE